MKRISHGPQLRLITEISVTPLLNLVLVVLFVFLMAAPMLKKGSVPATPAKPPVSAVLAVAHDQTITLDDAVVAQSALLETLKQRVAKEPKMGVVVRMDRKLPVQNLLEIMAVLKAAGVHLTAVAPAPEGKS